MIRQREFDVSELGMTHFLRTMDVADPPFIAIPVFPNRCFRPECGNQTARDMIIPKGRTDMTRTLASKKTHPLPAVADDPRWARIVARDHTADGHLWYSVMTTGVYCRPSCPSRLANSKNVQLHDTLAAARATGCRPCATAQGNIDCRTPEDRAECYRRLGAFPVE
jgi:Metal binding domain of Ada